MLIHDDALGEAALKLITKTTYTEVLHVASTLGECCFACIREQAQTEESAKTEKSETTTEPAASVGEEEIPSVEQAKDEAPVLEADQEQVSDDKDTDTGSEKK